jgi:hypothetical protein
MDTLYRPCHFVVGVAARGTDDLKTVSRIYSTVEVREKMNIVATLPPPVVNGTFDNYKNGNNC